MEVNIDLRGLCFDRITEKDAEELKQIFAEEVEKKNSRLFRFA
jgi:hypothetical protein